jgi:predicted phage terminase large subunit-like protein
LHVMRARLDYPDLKREVRNQAELFRPRNILIEDKASGTQLIQELIREGVHGVTRYGPTMDKTMRLYSVTSTIENGFVFLPKEADWLGIYLHELTSFPNGKNDDQADSTSQALDWAKQIPSRLPLEEFQRRQLLRWKLNLPDEYIFKQCEDEEEIIAEHFITGERIFWNGQFWQDWN